MNHKINKIYFWSLNILFLLVVIWFLYSLCGFDVFQTILFTLLFIYGSIGYEEEWQRKYGGRK